MYLFINYWYYYKCQAYGRLIFLCTWKPRYPSRKKTQSVRSAVAPGLVVCPDIQIGDQKLTLENPQQTWRQLYGRIVNQWSDLAGEIVPKDIT
jgi:hypothetical protein